MSEAPMTDVPRRRCDAQLFYDTEQSGRKMADGEARYLKGDRCLKTAAYEGVEQWGEKSYWCGTHAKNSNVVDYGPMTRLREKVPA